MAINSVGNPPQDDPGLRGLPVPMSAAFAHAFIAAEHDTRHNRVVHVSKDGKILRQFHVDYPLDLDLLPNGHLLLSSNLAVIELDADFQEVWRYGIEKLALFSCQKLADGHVLSGDTSRCRISLIDRSGSVVRFMPFPYAGDYLPQYDMFRLIRALPDGNLLVACYHDRKLAEFNWDGRIEWEASLEGPPYMPIRLPDGNTLVSLGPTGLIVEIDPAGKTLWRYDMVEDTGLDLGWIAGISKLKNGNLVYSDSKHDRLVEITPEKELVSCFLNREILLHPSTHIILES